MNNIEIINDNKRIDTLKKASEIKIIEYLNILWNLKYPCIEIKQLKNGFYLIYGDNKIIILDNNYKFKLEINDLDDIIYHISEIILNNNENEINLGIITIKKFVTISIDLYKNYNKIESYDFKGYLFLQVEESVFIICETEKTRLYHDFFNKICQHKITCISTRLNCNCIWLNENKNLLVLSSNEILPNGANILLFYDLAKNEEYYSIEESFIISNNGLLLLESENKTHKKILLSACKKYKSNQKNGILISISSFEKSNDRILSKFYETDNFEVYCFCQISLNNENYSEKYKSNYFLVGGFDLDIRQGLIKLYKAYFNENLDKNKIEFINDIQIEHINKKEIEIYKKKSKEEILRQKIKNGKFSEYEIIKINQDFKGFKGPITSLIQNKINGNILISCYDGNIYLFTPPNLDFYNKNESIYETQIK